MWRAPEKPAEGAPCNGCGLCCAAEPCLIAQDFLGATEGPCPAMVFAESRFWCGLVVKPSDYLDVPEFANGVIGDRIGNALGVGKGCDSDAPATGPSPTDNLRLP